MQLARLGDPGRERPVVRVGEDAYVDVSDVVGDFDEAFFGGGRARPAAHVVAERVAAGERARFAGERIGRRSPGRTRSSASG